jgi:hypothetical protein
MPTTPFVYPYVHPYGHPYIVSFSEAAVGLSVSHLLRFPKACKFLQDSGPQCKTLFGSKFDHL